MRGERLALQRGEEVKQTGMSIEFWFAWMGFTVLVAFGVAVLAATGD
jgi:hypothetical protein